MKKVNGREVYRALRKTYRCLKKEFKGIAEANDLTWAQFHALYHIDEKGVPFHFLSEHLHCHASNLTGLIDRMMEKGFVIREQSREDRRVWLIKLTDKGQDFKNKLLPAYQESIEKRFSVLSQEELVTLYDLLEKLRAGLD
ncbi:MAG: MarR family winged helix-turn-helix transcriptional regulator [Halanaerobiales bacterium]